MGLQVTNPGWNPIERSLSVFYTECLQKTAGDLGLSINNNMMMMMMMMTMTMTTTTTILALFFGFARSFMQFTLK